VELALDASALRNPPGGIEFAPPVDSVAAARWTRSAAVRSDGRLAPLERRDGRFRWTPSQPWSRPPRVLEWGHALERAAGSPARRQVLGP
jgi:hypothetical protein